MRPAGRLVLGIAAGCMGLKVAGGRLCSRAPLAVRTLGGGRLGALARRWRLWVRSGSDVTSGLPELFGSGVSCCHLLSAHSRSYAH